MAAIKQGHILSPTEFDGKDRDRLAEFYTARGELLTPACGSGRPGRFGNSAIEHQLGSSFHNANYSALGIEPYQLVIINQIVMRPNFSHLTQDVVVAGLANPPSSTTRRSTP